MTTNSKDKFKALLVFIVLVVVGMALGAMTDGVYVMGTWAGGIIGGLMWGKALFQKDTEGVKRDEHERIARLIETDEIEDTNHYEHDYMVGKRFR